MRELTVIKKSGKKVPFDRDKLERSVQIALRKRPVESERVDRMISGIVRRVESLGEASPRLSTLLTIPLIMRSTLSDSTGLFLNAI